MPGPDAAIIVARFGAPHGVRGEIRVKTFLEDPEDLGSYGRLTAENGARFTVRDVRVLKADLVVARFSEITDRDQAAALTGLSLSVPRSALPAAGEDSYYHTDLIGLRAETPAGEPLGEVAALYDFGAGDMIEVKGLTGGLKLYPFTRAAVPIVDIEGGRVVIDPPAESETPPAGPAAE